MAQTTNENEVIFARPDLNMVVIDYMWAAAFPNTLIYIEVVLIPIRN